MTPAMVKAKGGTAEVPVVDAAERRAAPRVLVDLEVDYASEDNYLFAYITDISETGIFVRTTSPEQPGTRLNLRFRPDGRVGADRDRGRGDLGQPVSARRARQPAPRHGHPVRRSRRDIRDRLLELGASLRLPV